MKRLTLTLVLALCGCAGASERDETVVEPVESSKVRPAVHHGDACVSPNAMEVLDVCAAGGVNSTEERLSAAAAEELRARAEEAWQTQRWTECSQLYSDLSVAHPDHDVRAEASYAAILCLNNHYEERQADLDAEPAIPVPPRRARKRQLSDEERRRAELERWSPRALSPLEISMELAYARNLCLAPGSDEVVTIKYRRARLHYTRNHWDVAATLFRDIVDRHPDSDLAPYAANQYLDCLNVISNIHPERRGACRAELAAEVERFMANEQLMRDEELRSSLAQLRCGILWARAEARTEAERFREAAALYLRIYSESRDDCEFIGSHDICEALYNAAMTYEAAHCIHAALRVRDRLMAECGESSEYGQSHGQASPWAKRAVYQSGGSYHALGDLSKAAEAYEDFATRFSGEKEAPISLHTAIGLRLALDQGDEALSDARTFEKLYGRRSLLKSATASAVFAAGEAYVKTKAWVDAERHYDSFLRRYGSVARPGEVIRAHVELGDAQMKRGPAFRTKGLAAMRRAVALAEGDGGDAMTRYRALVEAADVDGFDRSLSKARLVLLVDAVARAREALGEKAPERALVPQLGMSLDEAVEVLHFVSPPEGVDTAIERCEVEL